MLDMNFVFSFLRERKISVENLMHLGANFAQGRAEYVQNGAKNIMWVEAIPEIASYLEKTWQALMI